MANQIPERGLKPDELAAERAGELPERDAMSIIGVGGLEDGLPPPGLLDGVFESDVPVEALPVDGLPVEPPVVDDSIGIPDPAEASADASAKVRSGPT